MLNLKQATKFMLDNRENPKMAMNDPEMVEFVSDIDIAGAGILKGISKDELMASISLIQASVLADLLEDGEIKWAMALMADNKRFGYMMTIALKMSVGLASVEGWK